VHGELYHTIPNSSNTFHNITLVVQESVFRFQILVPKMHYKVLHKIVKFVFKKRSVKYGTHNRLLIAIQLCFRFLVRPFIGFLNNT
jgi:hypothetical protein